MSKELESGFAKDVEDRLWLIDRLDASITNSQDKIDTEMRKRDRYIDRYRLVCYPELFEKEIGWIAKEFAVPTSLVRNVRTQVRRKK